MPRNSDEFQRRISTGEQFCSLKHAGGWTDGCSAAHRHAGGTSLGRSRTTSYPGLAPASNVGRRQGHRSAPAGYARAGKCLGEGVYRPPLGCAAKRHQAASEGRPRLAAVRLARSSNCFHGGRYAVDAQSRRIHASDRPRYSFWRTILNIQPREFVVDSCHHRLTMGTGTVTESVVLPPLTGRACNASIKAACPGYRVPIAGIIDWDRDLSPALVIADLVHLAGLQWPILIPDAKRVKQAAAGLMPRNVIVSCSWRRAGLKRRF